MVTYINQHDFEGMKVFNFSASNLSVREYEPLLDFATKEKQKPFERVIIGIDFFKTSIDQSSTPIKYGCPNGKDGRAFLSL